MPVLSVVVPIYNVERYLSFCLDSIRGQTLEDIEIICVDDGSGDRSLLIAEAHALSDQRIKVLKKENGGLSSARNAGMRAASAEYVIFVDSDDYLDKRACETIVSIFEKTRAEVVTFGGKCVPSCDGGEWLERCLSPRFVEYEGFDERLLFEENSRPYAWRTALRRSFLEKHGLCFDESIPFGEDQVFHFEVYPLSSKTVLIPDKLYFYRVDRPGSLMREYADEKDRKVVQHIGIVEAVMAAWSSRGLDSLCPDRLVGWAVDFLLPDILDLPTNGRTESFGSLCRLLDKYYPGCSFWASGFGKRLRAVHESAEVVDDALARKLRRSHLCCALGKTGYFKLRLKDRCDGVKLLLKRILPLSAASTNSLLAELDERRRAEDGLEASLLLLGMERSAVE